MAGIKREKIIPYMDSYKIYLEKQERGVDSRPLSNTQEDYKRGIAEERNARVDEGIQQRTCR